LKKDVKAEMKYLQMMVKYAPEQEALVAKNRIETLSKN
jgi:hypothetical protein